MSVISGLGAILLVAFVAWGVRTLLRRETPATGAGHAVRRFFQYLLLYGLLWVAASGAAGLLGRPLDVGRALVDDPAALARATAFTVVGVPLYALLAVWTWRRIQTDPREPGSRAWRLYLTAASVTALAMAMTAAHDVLAWAARLEVYRGASAATLIVWGAVWGGHWWADRRLTPPHTLTPHRALGAVIGLGTTAAGAIGLLGDALRALLGLAPQGVLAGGAEPFVPAAVTLVVGLPVWLVYWLLPAPRYRRGPLWAGYLLLAGVAGGLVTAITSASLALYDALVWLVGDPAAPTTPEHFHRLPSTLAALAVGALLWWYHRTVLQEGARPARTEIRRLYEYLIAGIGLVAAAVGLMLLIVAGIEAATGPAGVIAGGTRPVNTMLAAATLLAVGGPVWWAYWRRIRQAVAGAAGGTGTPEVPGAAADERASPVRRAYVFALFGVAGVAAVVALLVGVVVALQDLFEGALSAETLRGVRYPVGVIVATGLLSAYHWVVYRADRASTQAGQRGPRSVLLVGPPDPAIARSLERRTGGQVRLWPRTDGVGAPWSADELADLLARQPAAAQVVVVADEQGMRVIPVARP